MGKLIIDNSVWFALGRGIQNGNTRFFREVRMKKILTGVNIAEIILSDGYFNKKGDLNEYLNLIRACIGYSDDIVFDHPLSYLLGIEDKESIRDAAGHYNFLYDIYFSTKDLKVIPNKLPDHTDEMLKAKKISASDFKEYTVQPILTPLNESIESILSNEDVTLDFSDEENLFGHFKNQIISFYETFAEIGKRDKGWDICNWKGIDITNNELLIDVTTLSFIERLKAKKKYVKNDIFDLLHLVYVSPGDKFWTKESQWIKIILSKPWLKDYLFKT